MLGEVLSWDDDIENNRPVKLICCTLRSDRFYSNRGSDTSLTVVLNHHAFAVIT